jgi:hypothetical protein
MGHFLVSFESETKDQLDQRRWWAAEERKRIGNRSGIGIRGIDKKSCDGETNRKVHYWPNAGWGVRHLADCAMPYIGRQPVRMGMEGLGCGYEGHQQQTN